MKAKLEEIRERAKEELSKANAVENLEELRVKYAGKKGELTAILKQMGKLSPEERPVIGQLANEVRSYIDNAIETKKAELQLISQSRKVSNSIFSLDFYQKEAVGGKITATTYEIFMADVSGVVVSDKKIIIADKTSKNGSERVSRIRLTLKSMDFKKTEIYYLTVMEKGTANIIEKIEFTIDIAFVNDFDF